MSEIWETLAVDTAFDDFTVMCNGTDLCIWHGKEYEQSLVSLCENNKNSSQFCMDAVISSNGPNSQVLDAINMYVIPILCLLGVLFNVVTIGIICKKRLWNSTSLYLTSLGIVDMLGLIWILFMSGGMHRLMGIKDISIVMIINHFLGIMVTIVIFTSNWLTVVLAVERYVAICHPVIAKVIYSKTRARIIVLIVCAFSFLIHLPQFFVYKHDTVTANGEQTVIHTFEKTVLGKSKIFRNFYVWVIHLILFLIIPSIILAGVNIRLIVEVRRSTDFIRKHSGIFLSVSTQRTLSREQTKIATMLIGLICVFFFFQLPIAIYIFLAMIMSEENFQQSRMQEILTILTTLIYVIKSDVNFVFYCWLCDRFLCTVKKLVCMNCVYYLPFLRGKQTVRNPNVNMSHTRSSRLSHNGSNSYIRCPVAKETTTV